MAALSKIIASAALAAWVSGAAAQGADRLDVNLEAAAKCSSATPVSPSLAAYRLLLSSKVVTRDRKGPVTIYAAPMAQNSAIKIWGLTPTKMVVVEREGSASALVGSLFSADFPLTNAQIVGAFQGGLKRQLDFRPLARTSMGGFPVSALEVTAEPVFQTSHLVNVKMASGERVVLCATTAQIEGLLR